MTSLNSFDCLRTLSLDNSTGRYYSLPVLAAQEHAQLERLPFAHRILLENLLRHEDGSTVQADDIRQLLHWDPQAEPSKEVFFMPARVLLQDFTGVPVVADLAAMRDAMADWGGDAGRINPSIPVDMVIDHSVQVDAFGHAGAFEYNRKKEYARNEERYTFLKWGQKALRNMRVVPPDTGIVHQVNLEYLADGVMRNADDLLYPDTVIGTDSHTTMINGLGVLGWGVGGIEAEAAMLGQPSSMLIPRVVGVRLNGQPGAGITATDIVLTITERLRAHGVVGCFVEFFGPGLSHLSLADRATIANMAPEYGATCGLFPVDSHTTDFLHLTGRSAQAERVESYYRAQGMWTDAQTGEAEYSSLVTIDLNSIEPSLAGPTRPQDRTPLAQVPASFLQHAHGSPSSQAPEWQRMEGEPVAHDPDFNLCDGSVVIAAITSCTNTSNPALLIAAGLLARKARAKGLNSQPWVKTSLAPGSRVVTAYLQQAGLLEELEALGFYLAGYGCTTCIGNSGPLPDAIAKAVQAGDLNVGAVLSGNRNFEGRVNALVKSNYLASPPLVVAYALAGNLRLDLSQNALGTDHDGKPVMLADIWPGLDEIQAVVDQVVTATQFKTSYADVLAGDEQWNALQAPSSDRYQWDAASQYIRQPSFLTGIAQTPAAVAPIQQARILALLGDSVTTDHISPAGAIQPDGPAGRYLQEQGIAPGDFNSYGARRGNHELMARGTFANIRLRNQLLPGSEGGVTVHAPSGEQMSIFDAAERYRSEGTPLVVIAGREYGTGSSRDWAAKGPLLLGVRAVIAQSFERIHRSNLIGMGILPLEFIPGESAEDWGLGVNSTLDLPALDTLQAKQLLTITVQHQDHSHSYQARVRIDTPKELAYFQHGGILPYVLRQFAA